ncbi:MAG: porin [Bacteroidaceae bacterium]|nr:porin [Bacteroidaceae bacterium]
MRNYIFSLILISSLFTPSLSSQVTTPSLTGRQGGGSAYTLGGYVITKANTTTRDGVDKKADMSLRLVRAYVDGRVNNVQYKVQMQFNGNTSKLDESGIRLLDAWAEWQPMTEARLKVGQMKRCFTFENPMHPWNIGFGAYSQLADKLAGFNDRVGEHPSNGRDLGIQLQGDLLPSRNDGHRWLHYQVGVYTGQGVNHADLNTRKDLIGGLFVQPTSHLQIGVFGWTGNYCKDNITVDRNRYSFGINYNDKWTFRSELAFSEGHRISDYNIATGAVSGYDNTDAWYVELGTPTFCDSRIFCRWDVYREGKTWDNAKTIYALSAQHNFDRNLMLQANYGFNADKSASLGRYYHTLDLQLYWRF